MSPADGTNLLTDPTLPPTQIWEPDEPTVLAHPGDDVELELIEGLEETQPVDRSWIEQGLISALIVSLVLHAWIMSTLGSIHFEHDYVVATLPLETRITEVQPEPDPVEEAIEYELANPDDREHELHEAINARSVGMAHTTEVKLESEPQIPRPEMQVPVPTLPVYDVSEGMEVDDRIVVKGSTGESLVQMDAALDRVTWEIADNMKEHKVLVVWLLDASASLTEQRQAVAKRLKRVYGELQALEKAGQIPQTEQPLLSAVAVFGAQTKFLTADPTDKADVIINAVQNAPSDPSGVENVFTALEMVMKKWMHYRNKMGRRIMIVTITDEAGDDWGQMEIAINMINRHGARAYVLGPSAPFGRRQGFVPYVHPQDSKTYQIPVDLGPETPVAENVQLPFWYSGPQYEYLSSGLGPYALARLVRETGGAYFMTNMVTMSGLAPVGSYESDSMKPFEPEYTYSSPEAWMRDIQRSPLRRAVVEASMRSLQYKAKGTPDLELKVTPQNYQRVLSDAQKTVAESTLMIETILEAYKGNLEPEYQKETSPRWRAAYDLSYGRLLAQQVRCYEYNLACAQMKTIGGQDVATKSNHWIFRPDDNINYATTMKKRALEAEKLLKRVVQNAPGTPWAVLASRELKDPFGIKVVERFDPPPPPPKAGNPNVGNDKKKGVLLLADDVKKKAPPKPPEAPKPPPVLPKF